MALPVEKAYTLEDIYALPDGSRAELIDGQLYMIPPHGTEYQRISCQLSADITFYLREHKKDSEVFSAPFAVFLDADEKTYVEPDLTVICDRDKLYERGCNGAPDWIIEIVSHGSKRMDYFVKLFKYRTAGVKEYWIVDPEKNRTMVYDFQNDDVSTFDFTESVPVLLSGSELKLQISR